MEEIFINLELIIFEIRSKKKQPIVNLLAILYLKKKS